MGNNMKSEQNDFCLALIHWITSIVDKNGFPVMPDYAML